MSLLKALGLVRAPAPLAAADDVADTVEARAEARRAVFQEAQLTFSDFHKVRAVITELGASGARVQFASMVDLPFRVRLSAPLLKINCWARVVWQADGAAGLAFQENL